MRISDWSADVCSSDLIGDPLAEGTLMGPLIDADAVQRYKAAIAAAKEAGGTVLAGNGTLVDRPGHFVLPTLISGVDNSHAVIQTETFAPILYIIAFDTLDEAIELQNAEIGRAHV